MASSWLDVAFAAVLLESLRCPYFFRSVFLLLVEPESPILSRGASKRRERSSSSTGDHYSSETAGAPPVGRRARSVRTTPSDYVQKTLLPGACSSPRLSGRALPASCFTATPQRTGLSPTHQTCSLRAQPSCCTLSAFALRNNLHISSGSQRNPQDCPSTCSSFRASGTLGICTHQRQVYWHQHF